MSTYDNLPVYKASYDLLVEIFKFVKIFSREYKYTIWEELKKEVLWVIRTIYKANSSFEKRKDNIKESRIHIETLRLYLRLCKDLKIIWIPKFVFLNQIIESISKQLLFWERSTK